VRTKLGLGLAALILVGAASPAAGARPEPGRRGELHCVFELRPVERTARAVFTEPLPRGCFSTQAESMAVGTNGNVILPPDTEAEDLSQDLIDQFTVVIGREFDEGSFVDKLVEYYAPTGCNQNTWVVNYVGNSLNDRFESGKGFAHCDLNRKFEDADLGGASILCTPHCSAYGVLRDEVSSLRWKA